MHSALPKVLHPLAGQPLVGARDRRGARAVAAGHRVVVGMAADAVRAALAAPDLASCGRIRRAAPATRRASRSPRCPSDGVTLVTIGDVPLVPPAALGGARAARARTASLARARPRTCPIRPASAASCATRRPRARDRRGTRRERCATRRSTRSIPACMAAPTALLSRWVGALTPDNAQGEYYLTDVVALARRDGIAGRRARSRADERDVRRHQRPRAARGGRAHAAARGAPTALMRGGRRIADPARIDMRGSARLRPRRDASTSAACSRATSRSATACASGRIACCAT